MRVAEILSGGIGTRLGTDIPKQYITVGGRMLISYCIESVLMSPEIDAIQIVAASEWEPEITKCIQELDCSEKFKGFSTPGSNRQLSILHGLEDIRQYADDESVVLVCDAARPLLSEIMIRECMESAEAHDGVIPVLPLKDTVYSSKDGRHIDGLLNRSEIYAGQAPEAFRLGKYYEANQKLLPDEILKINGSTEPAVLAGMDIAMIPGDEGNFKITTQEDLDRFRDIIGKQKHQGEK